MTHVSLIVLDRAMATGITIPLEMLYAARTLGFSGAQAASNQLRLDVVGLDLAPVTMAGGLRVLPTAEISHIESTDLIFIPGFWGSPHKHLRRCGALLDWLVRCHAGGSKVCSLVTGGYFLAQAGLLDGRRATTHWYYFDDFQKRFPRVRLDRKRFITLDERLYCTGSVNAVRDVTLHLVEELFDSRIAAEIAKHFTHEIKRSYESLLLGYQQHDTHHDEQIIKVQEWLQASYASEISLQEVAAQFSMSVRSLNRRFRAAAKLSPLQYLQEIRIEQAKQLLKHSNLTIAEVSFSVGYQDASYFSGLFRKHTDVSPAEYRGLVRSKVFRVED